MVKDIVLKTSRLLLKSLLEEDFQEILKLQEENSKIDWFQFDIKDFQQFKNKKLSDYSFSINLKTTNSFIGICELQIPKNKPQAHLFYALLSNFWGNGYAYEAINLLIKFAFSELLLDQISAYFDNSNNNAWKVVERSGLKYLGQFKINNSNMMLFSINKKEYLNQNWY